MARAPVTDEVDVLDEEFQHHVKRGAELLAGGDAASAVIALERARELRPTDAQVLGLLGQALYRLGRFERAIEVYQRLVDASPAEAAARVNLGLASLKARRYPDAIRQLEIALDLHPDHQRAMGYLGLAWLEHGEPARARAWFERAGSAQMVARCDELLAAAAELAERAGAEQDRSPGSAPAAVSPARAGQRDSAIEPLVELTLGRGAPFSVERGLLTVSIHDEVLVRAEGLVAVHGPVRLGAEPRRSRGSPTERPFGDGARRMLRASGDGALVYAPRGKRLFRLDLEDEPGYFRDEAVFSFEGRLGFENGRLASRTGTGVGLEVVHLQGRGQVLLAASTDVVAVTIAGEAPLRVRLSALVGWVGALTPQFATLPGDRDAAAEPDGDLSAIELSGTGRVLLEGAAG